MSHLESHCSFLTCFLAARHTPVHRLYKQPFVWNKSIWLLLQHNLFFSTSENVTSRASSKKKLLNVQNESRIFHCDFKLSYFLDKTEVVYFPRKIYMETFFSEGIKTTILFFLITQKNWFLQD